MKKPLHRRRALFTTLTTLTMVAAGGLLSCTDGAAGDGKSTASDGAENAADSGFSQEDAAAGTPDTGSGPVAPTWHSAVQGIVGEHCGACHSAGGIGPFRLDRPDDWQTMAQPSWNAIEHGTMPPFLADPDCGSFHKIRAMPKADKQAIKDWLGAGQPLGTPGPNDRKAPPIPKLEATHSAPMPEPYSPPTTTSDDYRCFLLDLEFKEDTYLRGSQVVPGAKALVHHVLVYALRGDQLKAAQDADAKQKGPGYTCFGGPLPSSGGNILGQFSGGFPTQLAAWVPGLEPTVRPEGLATRIRKGSRIVMQVHYNVVGGKTEADTTRIDMILSTAKPKHLLATRPLLIHDLDIPPNMTSAHQRLFRYYGKAPLKILSLTPHMHLLASEFKATVVRKDKTEQCALNVPKWDFQWQQGYGRPQDDPLVLNDGDGIEMRCVYNNKPENQPMVDGKQITPKQVKWGDGSHDEMCMLYLDMAEPYTEPPPDDAKVCHGFDKCEADCKAKGRTECIMGCQEVAPACHTCAIQQIISCAATKCPIALLGAQDCLTRCLVGGAILGSNPGACLAAECGDKYEGVRKCLDPALKSSACTKKMATCGL